MSGSQSDDGFNKERADLFEALGHPLRLEILRALSESPLGFADLKRRVNVTSSGHLTHHLEKLDGLVMTTPDGLYRLSDDGTEALRLMDMVLSERMGRGNHILASLMKHREAILATLLTALIILSAVSVLNIFLPTSRPKYEHLVIDSATITWYPDNYTVAVGYHNDGTATVNIMDVIMGSYGLAYWRNATINGAEASAVVAGGGISVPAGASGTLLLGVPSSENWPFNINQTIEIILSSSLGNYYYTFVQVGSNGETYVTLTDGQAGLVCEALRLPCPLNPSFLAVQEGSGQNITCVVTVKINQVAYTVTLNDTSYTVVPRLP